MFTDKSICFVPVFFKESPYAISFIVLRIDSLCLGSFVCSYAFCILSSVAFFEASVLFFDADPEVTVLFDASFFTVVLFCPFFAFFCAVDVLLAADFAVVVDLKAFFTASEENSNESRLVLLTDDVVLFLVTVTVLFVFVVVFVFVVEVFDWELLEAVLVFEVEVFGAVCFAVGEE